MGKQEKISTSEKVALHKWRKEYPIIVMAITSITVAIISGLVVAVPAWYMGNMHAMKNIDSMIDGKIEGLSTADKDIITKIDGVNNELNNQIKELDRQINYGEDSLVVRIKELENSNTLISTKEKDTATVLSNHDSESVVSLNSDTVLGEDFNGRKYTARELIGRPILLSFKQGSSEVYFLGQYNKKYQWYGYCITNEFDSNGILQGIHESNFENGKRRDYKSVIKKTGNVWIYSNGGNEDENIEYKMESLEPKVFNQKSVRTGDIISVDDFINRYRTR